MILFTVIFGLSAIVALMGNVLVLLLVTLDHHFHKTRHCLLASLALSDFLFAALITSNRAVATALDQWPFSTTWCHGAAFIIRMLHLSTFFHLCAVSYERYIAIVKKPLIYIGNITKERVFLNFALLWILPAVISFGLFMCLGDYVYNPQIFICEQKWYRQITVPFFIAAFIIPLGIIIFLNFKLLKVVRRLQSGVKLFRDLCTTENKTTNWMTQQQPCSGNDQYQDPNQQQPEKLENLGGIENNEHGNSPPIQNVTVKCVLSCEPQGEENSAYLTDPDDVAETIHGDAHAAQYRRDTAQSRSHKSKYRSHPSTRHSYSLGVNLNNPSFAKTRLNGQRKIYKEAVETKCYKNIISQDQKEDLQIPPQVVENEQEKLAKIAAQKDESFQQRQSATTLEENSDFQERGLTSQTQMRQGKNGFIRRTLTKVSANNAVGVKTEVSSSRSEKPPVLEKKTRILNRRTKVGPEYDIQVIDQPVTEATVLRGFSGREGCLTTYLNQETLQGHLQEDQKSQTITGGPPQFAPKQNRPPGKTQIILVKLLREGKAARDVMIIIVAFVVCFLPMWIMALYLSLGGRSSAETILSIHCVYSLSMVCNPVIYSVRKKEFRKAVIKMLKLQNKCF